MFIKPCGFHVESLLQLDKSVLLSSISFYHLSYACYIWPCNILQKFERVVQDWRCRLYDVHLWKWCFERTIVSREKWQCLFPVSGWSFHDQDTEKIRSKGVFILWFLFISSWCNCWYWYINFLRGLSSTGSVPYFILPGCFLQWSLVINDILAKKWPMTSLCSECCQVKC